jgi:cobalt-zinc-cadmium efflux system outer membrane protein
MTGPSRTYLLLMFLGAGCASVSPERGHDRVSTIVGERTGRRTQWEKGPPDEASVADWVRRVTAAGLTRDEAVEIALVNSPALAQTYEDLGISQADMVQAGLLKNPTFGAEVGFAITSGATREVRLSLVQDFLDLFVLPLRKEIARDQFEADTLRVAHAALETVAEVEKAFVAAQTRAELVAYRRTVVEAAAAAAELAERQFEAGNISELQRASERAAYEQARLDLTREEIELLEGRERINRLLGLWGETTSWRFVERLPALPGPEPELAHLEAFAMRRRLDVAVARRRAALLSKAVGLARSTRLVGRLDVGVDAHQDPDGPRVLGPNLEIELPIFDQRQAVIARLEAQQRQQERRLAATAIDARSEVRIAEARLRAARETVVHFRDVLVPLRKEVAAQSLLHYNGMFISPFQLLAAKQDEIDARRGYLEALRDYWSARAELARALGGALPPESAAKSPPTPPSKPPATPSTAPVPVPPAPEESHEHAH